MDEPVQKMNPVPKICVSKDMPTIIKMVESARDISINGEIIPFLFKKEMIHLPKSLLIGKSITYPIAKQGIDSEDANPPLSLLWDACKQDGTFDYLYQQKESMNLEAYLGLYYNINQNGDGNFPYLVGSLMKDSAVVPEGFAFQEIPESDVAVCWYRYEDEDDIWSVAHSTVEKYMEEQGYEGISEAGWCSELYAFRDEIYEAETGFHILGYLIFCKKKEEVK